MNKGKTTDLAYGACRKDPEPITCESFRLVEKQLDELMKEFRRLEPMVMAKLKCTCEEALNKLGFKGR